AIAYLFIDQLGKLVVFILGKKLCGVAVHLVAMLQRPVLVVVGKSFSNYFFGIAAEPFMVGIGFLRHSREIQQRFRSGVASEMVDGVGGDGSSFFIIPGIGFRPAVVFNVLYITCRRQRLGALVMALRILRKNILS